jgi:uncharacterized protein (DUF302 family)
MTRSARIFASGLLVTAALAFGTPDFAAAASNGVVKVKSGYSVEETVARIKSDVAEKGIKLFDVIDQAKLAKDAGVDLKPSTLIVFGNPPLGTQFITARPEAGLDWPVRLLVYQDKNGQVWTAYSDFNWIAHRHGIKNRGPQFKMASEVISSIISSVSVK